MISVSTVLDEWSTSSGIWLTCSVSEDFIMRNFENYGFYEGDSPPRYECCEGEDCVHEYNTPEIQKDRTRELKKACPKDRAEGMRAPCESECFW
jgi:hypothetical protein